MKSIPEWSPFRAYAQKRTNWQNWITLFLLLAGCFWLYFAARNIPAYQWNWQACRQFLWTADSRPGLLMQGLVTTLRVGFWTFLFAIFIGTILGLWGTGKSFSLPYQIFVNLIRNTPPLVLLFCIYFLTGSLISVTPIEDAIQHSSQEMRDFFAWFIAPQGQIDRMLACVLALGFYQGAYIAEIVRGSLESVPKGQWDAAQALGFSRRQTLLLVIFPQSLRLALPPLTGQCITTFKESSLASLISIPDLTFQSLEIMAVSGMTFEVWITAGLLYLVLGLICAIMGRMFERLFTVA